MSNGLVTAHIQGGLGNQLFQIAATYNYAYKYNKTPIFFNTDYLHNSHNFERRTFWNTLFSNKLTILKKEEYHKLKQNIIILNEYKNDIYTPFPNVVGHALLLGYFQSLKYLTKEVRNTMIDLIYSNEDFMYSSYEYYENIKKHFSKLEKEKNNIDIEITDDDMISLHVRRGDYVLLNWELNDSYIKKAIERANKKYIAVFSDDIEWCKENIKNDFVFFVELNDVALEFITMSLFQNNIIANSTYSWFASFISSYKNKLVIAPSQWIATDIPFNNNELYMSHMIVL